MTVCTWCRAPVTNDDDIGLEIPPPKTLKNALDRGFVSATFCRHCVEGDEVDG